MANFNVTLVILMGVQKLGPLRKLRPRPYESLNSDNIDVQYLDSKVEKNKTKKQKQKQTNTDEDILFDGGMLMLVLLF